MIIIIFITTIMLHPVHANMRRLWPRIVAEFEEMIGFVFLTGEDSTFFLLWNSGWFASIFFHIQISIVHVMNSVYKFSYDSVPWFISFN